MRWIGVPIAAIPIPLHDFLVDLRKRVHEVWREDGTDPRTHARKLATHHAWMGSPLKPSTARGPPCLLPRYQHLELRRHVLHFITLLGLAYVPTS